MKETLPRDRGGRTKGLRHACRRGGGTGWAGTGACRGYLALVVGSVAGESLNAHRSEKEGTRSQASNCLLRIDYTMLLHSMAAESESESVGVGNFDRSRSRSR